jgi:putative Holliday junction resolvase
MGKTAKVSNYLGLDYGQSKIGLAVADSEIRIAFAYITIENDKNFLDVLAKIIEIENIDQIIIGKLDNAGAGKKAFEAEEIGERLKKEFKIPVAYQEEMFSTKMAENNLKERGAKKIKKLDNQEAARIILQSWLEKKLQP